MVDCVVVVAMSVEMCSDGGFAMPGEEMEEAGEQEGGGWDVDEELELPPDLVSTDLVSAWISAASHVVCIAEYWMCN